MPSDDTFCIDIAILSPASKMLNFMENFHLEVQLLHSSSKYHANVSILYEWSYCIELTNSSLNCPIIVHSEDGELYAKKLANFIEKRLKSEKTATVCNCMDLKDQFNHQKMSR